LTTARRDYYELLGVRVDASPRDIRLAYQRLARQCSPDLNPWDAQSRVIFEEIHEAYRVLSDISARSLYDRLGHSAFTRTGQEQKPGFSRSRAVKGEDLQYPIELSLEDSLRGLMASFEVHRLGPCSACGGAGVPAGASPDVCSECGGSGEVWLVRGSTRIPSLCSVCKGSGQIAHVVCEECRGRGLGPVRATVAVTIPPGVDTGSEVRVKGEGHAGGFGAPPGDLVIITRIRPHPVFSRKGDNLHCEVPITVTEAVLGARVEVPAPNGVAFLILPPGTQSGQVFRLRGKGSSRLHGEGRGDLYVMVRVVTPKEVTPRTEELFRELERLMPDNPRATLFAQVGMTKPKAS